jgi:hypothetical protein
VKVEIRDEAFGGEKDRVAREFNLYPLRFAFLVQRGIDFNFGHK